MLDMKEKGVIEESDGPWSSPVVLARKKNGDLHFCVDYSKLNDVTKEDCFPLPRTDDTLDTLAGAKWLSKLDLKWQEALHPDDKEKTTFYTGQGLWQFTVMPYWLCNAPATFERLMESVLRGLIYEASVDVRRHVLRMGRQEVTLWNPRARPRSWRLTLLSDEVIPARCEKVATTRRDATMEAAIAAAWPPARLREVTRVPTETLPTPHGRRRNERPVCWRCGKPGHFRRYFRNRPPEKRDQYSRTRRGPPHQPYTLVSHLRYQPSGPRTA
jgi:hypothetical protein